MKTRQKNSVQGRTPLVLFLALYQLAGGLVGLGLCLKMIPALQQPSTSTWVGIVLAAVLYTFSILCGFLLFQVTRQAFLFSLANQILQVFSFGVTGLAYNYVAGLKVGVGVDFLTSWVFKLKFSLSSFTFSVGTHTGASFVAVNLLALVLLYLLERAKEAANV
ncbi:hypothetical protein ACD591_17980 [Rufibacter glacialis]|uniref:Uncharacterized protein n=1 Tax=Rufibacter glacialis TaxID=1259555 RepID=A0A5M8Q5X8_9BACT|nr:hypothetical protein [Rufibacter glacialis]KAA6430733.1 hypothetical protein FOE74_19900 [Rufibacter glacialis]GGK86323.1 hypothetical protein GCM10011405_37550 [Rufibacter glacialis]